jgi:hypothetical protein
MKTVKINWSRQELIFVLHILEQRQEKEIKIYVKTYPRYKLIIKGKQNNTNITLTNKNDINNKIEYGLHNTLLSKKKKIEMYTSKLKDEIYSSYENYLTIQFDVEEEEDKQNQEISKSKKRKIMNVYNRRNVIR